VVELKKEMTRSIFDKFKDAFQKQVSGGSSRSSSSGSSNGGGGGGGSRWL